MPALFFVLFAAALPETRQVSPALVGSVFYLLCFAILFDINDKAPDTFSVFTAGIVLALGSMFYLKLIWFLPLIWISLGTLRSVTWRELLYPVIAYLLMGLFLFTWYWGVLDQGYRFLELLGKNLAFEGSYEHLFQSNHFSVLIYYGFITASGHCGKCSHDRPVPVKKDRGAKHLPGSLLHVYCRHPVLSPLSPGLNLPLWFTLPFPFHTSSPITSTGNKVHGPMN